MCACVGAESGVILWFKVEQETNPDSSTFHLLSDLDWSEMFFLQICPLWFNKRPSLCWNECGFRFKAFFLAVSNYYQSNFRAVFSRFEKLSVESIEISFIAKNYPKQQGHHYLIYIQYTYNKSDFNGLPRSFQFEALQISFTLCVITFLYLFIISFLFSLFVCLRMSAVFVLEQF